MVERLRAIFGDKYSYEQVDYKNMKTPITLICHEKDANGVEHGAFSMRPDNIFSSHQECPKCYNDRRSLAQLKPVEQFIEEATKVHGGLYEYHKVEYKGDKTKVCIVCPVHGDFGKHLLTIYEEKAALIAQEMQRNGTRKLVSMKHVGTNTLQILALEPLPHIIKRE